jgi:hypothetical protein
VNDIRCLCTHSAADHGLANDEARGEVRAPCQYCHCDVFEEDPTLIDIRDHMKPSKTIQEWMDRELADPAFRADVQKELEAMRAEQDGARPSSLVDDSPGVVLE